MKYIFLYLLLLPFAANSQVADPMEPLKEEDQLKSEINDGTARLLLVFSTDLRLAVMPSYEHVIKNALTFTIKGGAAFGRESLYLYTNGVYDYRFTTRLIAASEIRYYYNLQRRKRLGKTVRNFSAGYISVEPMVASPTLYILNREGAKNDPAYFAGYINIGFQKQVKKSYFGAFFGTRFPGKIYSNSVDVTDILHAGFFAGGIF